MGQFLPSNHKPSLVITDSRQFIRKTAPCGSYYDQPVPFAHEVLCDFCHQPVDKKNVVTDTEHQICPHCIQSGRVKQCSQCGEWVSQHMAWFKWNDQSRFGDRVYCDQCKPPIIFVFKIGEPFLKDIDLPIPVNREMGLPLSYFYQAIARELQIDVQRIHIPQLLGPYDEKDQVMVCPAEFLEESHRTFNVKIL